MHFDVTLTAEDYREAYAPPTTGNRWLARWSDLIALGSLLVVVLPSAFPGRGPFGTPVSDRRIDGPRQNLWLTLAPMLFVATWMSAKAVVNRWGGWRPSATVRGDPVAHARRVGTALMIGQLVAAGWLAVPLYGRWAIVWTPTDGEVLCAAVSPWLFYLLLLRLMKRDPHTRLGDLLWSAAPAARRLRSFSLSPDGVTADDRTSVTRFGWSHFVRYRETDNLLLLVTEDGDLMMLPKRAAAADPAGDAELRSLLQAHVAVGTFLPRESRFPVVVAGG